MTSQLSFRFSWARALTLGLAVSAIALLAPDCSGPTLRAGVCVRDITPITPNLTAAYTAAFGGPAAVNHTDPVFIAGFGDNRQATGYNDQLWRVASSSTASTRALRSCRSMWWAT